MRALMVLALAAIASSANADTAQFKTEVTKIFTDDENFGGCMFGVKPGPADQGLNCKNAFVTLDCKGDYGPKSTASSKYAAVQLAYVTGQNIEVKVDDTRKHNGYCLGVRVDNIKY